MCHGSCVYMLYLQVWCDQLPGNLDLHRMMVIPQAGEVSTGPAAVSVTTVTGLCSVDRTLWRRLPQGCCADMLALPAACVFCSWSHVQREGQPMSLSQFEILGGRGSARKWRRSVSVQDDGQMISLGDWLEKYAETPGEGPVAPTYSRWVTACFLCS